MDVSGKILHFENTSANIISLNLSQFADGVYFLEISNEAFIGVQKVIKQ